MDMDRSALEAWQHRLRQKNRALEFTREWVIPALVVCGWTTLVGNFLGQKKTDVFGEEIEYPIPPIIGVLSLALVLIVGGLLAWQRQKVKEEWERFYNTRVSSAGSSSTPTPTPVESQPAHASHSQSATMDSRSSSDSVSDVKSFIAHPLTQGILGFAGLAIGLYQLGQGN